MKNITFENTPGIFCVDSGKAGKTLSVMGGVHGNERCGVTAITQFLNSDFVQKITSGKVYFIIANPYATTMNRRCMDYNMNRAFQFKVGDKNAPHAYEVKRAWEIMPYLDKSEALLDLHSMFDVGDKPFAIGEPRCYDLALHINVDVVSSGWDKAHPGGTDYYMSKQEKVGLCVECGQHEDLEHATPFALKAIKDYLGFYGMLEGGFPEKNQSQIRISAKFIYRTKTDFIFTKKFRSFELVEEGQLLGVDGKEKVYAKFSGRIIFPYNCSKADQEAFVLGVEE